jgi:hypothetical protein
VSIYVVYSTDVQLKERKKTAEYFYVLRNHITT